MKMIALMKIWGGEEWLLPCVQSIYDFNYKIILLTSDISWIGGRENPSIPEIERIIKEFDPEKKIIHLNSRRH